MIHELELIVNAKNNNIKFKIDIIPECINLNDIINKRILIKEIEDN